MIVFAVNVKPVALRREIKKIQTILLVFISDLWSFFNKLTANTFVQSFFFFLAALKFEILANDIRKAKLASIS